MTENITTGLIKTYHDEEKTKLKEEYFICDGKKKDSTNHIGVMGNYTAQ